MPARWLDRTEGAERSERQIALRRGRQLRWHAKIRVDQPESESMRYKGRITEWRDERGFGFVTPMEGGERVFIHIKSFARRARRPVGNEFVTYRLKKDPKGRPQGVDVRFSGQPARAASKTKPVHGSRGPQLFVVLFIGALGVTAMLGRLPFVVPVVYIVASLVTFSVYAWDKAAAQNNRRRTPESHLQILALACGWPGALLAQQVLRHKSSKQPFRIVFWMTVVLNCAALGWVIYDPGVLEPAQSFVSSAMSSSAL